MLQFDGESRWRVSHWHDRWLCLYLRYALRQSLYDAGAQSARRLLRAQSAWTSCHYRLRFEVIGATRLNLAVVDVVCMLLSEQILMGKCAID